MKPLSALVIQQVALQENITPHRITMKTKLAANSRIYDPQAVDPCKCQDLTIILLLFGKIFNLFSYFYVLLLFYV